MEAKEVTTLKSWFVDLIVYFRKEFDSLPAEAKSFVSADTTYLPNCQIEVLWLKQPEYQLIIKSNFRERPDMDIVLHGPLSEEQFLPEAEALVTSPQWAMTELTEDHRSVDYAQSLASTLNTFMSNVRASVFGPKHPKGMRFGMRVSDEVWVEMYEGNLAQEDYVKFGNSMINVIRTRFEESKKPKPSQIQPQLAKNDGFVTFFYPPIDLGSVRKPTPSEILRGGNFDFRPPAKAFDLSFNGIPLVVNTNGLIFIGCDDKETALRILNTIMAMGTLSGVTMYAVGEHEIGQGKLDREEMAIGGHGIPMSTIRMMQSDFTRRPYFPGTPVEPSKMTSIINRAAGLFHDHKLTEELRLLIESYTHLNDSEFAQSFILSWSIIERHVYQSWLRKLDDMDLDEERLSKLRGQTVDYLLEVLNVAGDLPEPDYERYMELKVKRNKFIHKGKPIRKEDAEKCYEIAKQIIQARLPK